MMAPEVDPIDSGLFGFKVGSLGPDFAITPDSVTDVCKWMDRNDCRLVSISVAVGRLGEMATLQRFGAQVIDLSLTMVLPMASRRLRHVGEVKVRLADGKDLDPILDIAATEFEFGRYHRDPDFPRHLADERYRHFVRNAITQPQDGECVFVDECNEQINAFMVVRRSGRTAQWVLGGVKSDEAVAMLGPLFFSGVVNALAADSVRSMRAKISAANTNVLNVYSLLGFMATKPEWMLHLRSR
jgi:hypothetical protein